MKFQVSRSDLLNELTIVSRAVSLKSPVPTLTGIKIEAVNNELHFTGSENDISIYSILKKSESTELSIQEEGTIILSAKYICDIIRKMEDDIITIEIIDGTLTRICGTSSDFKINGHAGNDYPFIDFSIPNQSFVLSSNSLKEIIDQTIFATSDKEARPVLTGVNFKCEKGSLCFVATDSYRLAKKIISTESDMNFAITIPSKTLNEVNKTLVENEDVTIAVNDRKIQFIIGNTIIQSRLIEGAYPETSRLIPQTFDYELTINSSELLGAIDRCILMKYDGVSTIRLSMTPERVELFSKSQELGSVKEVLEDAEFKGNKLEISFSGNYAIEAIRALNEEKIHIYFSGDMKPFIIRGEKDESCLQLILPVRTYN